jgi:hypothetical protein
MESSPQLQMKVNLKSIQKMTSIAVVAKQAMEFMLHLLRKKKKRKY